MIILNKDVVWNIKLLFVGLTSSLLFSGCSTNQYSAWDDVVENNPDEAIRKIADGANYKGEGYNGDRLTHWAARHGQADVLSLLLDKGLKVDRQNRSKSTPLMIAIGYQNKGLTALLLDRGANVNHRNKQGFTPLYLAVLHSNMELVDLLLSKGADANSPGPNGVAPLHKTLQMGNRLIGERLLESGASWDVVSDYGDTSLHWAAAGGQAELVGAAIRGGTNINIANERGDTPLIAASALGNVQVVDILLQNGATLAVNREGSSPLHFAVGSGDADLVRLLLEHGADPDQLDKQGWTPTLIASDLADDELLKLLAPNLSSAQLSTSNAGASLASARILLQLETSVAQEKAKEHLLLAKTQYSQRAETLAKDAQGRRAAARAGRMFGEALVGAALQQQQQASLRQLNQIAALNITSDRGGGYITYNRVLSQLEVVEQTTPDVFPSYVELEDGDVGMLLVESKAAAQKSLEVSELLRENGWDTEQVSSLTLQDEGRSWLTGAPAGFERAPGFWGGGSTEFCESLLPVSIRSLVGTGKLIGRSVVSLEDHYETALAPVHFLWESPPVQPPVDIREARCAKAVFTANCKHTMGWLDEIRTFGGECEIAP